MNRSTRRMFLRKFALVTLGTGGATSGLALGETEAESTLRGMDGELANVLRSYGRADSMVKAGHQKARVGSKTRRLPVSRLGVEVRDQESFQRSFETLTGLSDRVMVDGNKVSFARDSHYFVIENRVA